MNRDELLALAARVEAATGADRMIDAALHIALGRPVAECADEDGCLYQQLASVPAYTASLDAAASLVPEGWHAVIHARPDYPGVELHEFPLPCRRVPFLHAATPALALTAAALRARAEEVGMSDRAPCRHLTQSAEAYYLAPDGSEHRVRALLCDWPSTQPVTTWPTWMQKRCGGGDALHDGAPECEGCPAYQERTADAE